jgi:hypothetical protein
MSCPESWCPPSEVVAIIQPAHRVIITGIYLSEASYLHSANTLLLPLAKYPQLLVTLYVAYECLRSSDITD